MQFTPQSPDLAHRSTLEFAWVELTNRCNLRCSHCYTESTPFSGERDLLSLADYKRILGELRNVGCSKIQFIGGEPTLNRDLPALIRHAKEVGFAFIEVFSNLVTVRPQVWDAFKQSGCAVATSFYSYDRDTHNKITNSRVAFDHTLRSIQRCADSRIPLRVGVIEMEENTGHFDRTVAFLRKFGVENVGRDHARPIGRHGLGADPDMRELCGSCAGNIISIAPDGVVAPCNMARHWTVGSLLDYSLSELLQAPRLGALRQEIANHTSGKDAVHAICDPRTCSPYDSCCPSTQSCSPCAPNGCRPCYPNG